MHIIVAQIVYVRRFFFLCSLLFVALCCVFVFFALFASYLKRKIPLTMLSIAVEEVFEIIYSPWCCSIIWVDWLHRFQSSVLMDCLLCYFRQHSTWTVRATWTDNDCVDKIYYILHVYIPATKSFPVCHIQAFAHNPNAFRNLHNFKIIVCANIRYANLDCNSSKCIRYMEAKREQCAKRGTETKMLISRISDLFLNIIFLAT